MSQENVEIVRGALEVSSRGMRASSFGWLTPIAGCIGVRLSLTPRPSIRGWDGLMDYLTSRCRARPRTVCCSGRRRFAS
jgi:hypothetical protein